MGILRQIDATLERWRWLPESLGETYVLVNIAGFELQMVENGEEVLRKRVIVGQPFRQTPVFSDRIRYLVFNPDWTVPRTVMVQEAGPQNALGQVKFMFPNQYDVYLHDTPGRGLFTRSERSFSSGCPGRRLH